MSRIYCQKDIAYFVKMKLRTYCLSCREHINSIGSKRVTMTNKVVEYKTNQFLSDKLQFMEQEDSKSS